MAPSKQLTHGRVSNTHSAFYAVVSFALVGLLAVAGCGGNNAAPPDGGDRLPDNEPCVPGAQRCNGNEAQTCNAEGTMWVTQETCASFCEEGVCAIEGLDITSDMQLDGTVVVANAVVVRAGATLSSPTGSLTIIAGSITVENGGSISVAATGAVVAGKGFDATCLGCSSGGGRYSYGTSRDSEVQPGAEGGKEFGTALNPAKGGGVLRLLAKGQMVMGGTLSAVGENGTTTSASCQPGGGGGSGGGILLLADDLQFTGAISAAGGLGGVHSCGAAGQPGGPGRVKLLFGGNKVITGQIIAGQLTQGLAPPVPLKSLTHPDPAKIYNDGFVSFDVEWKKAFPSTMGYYFRLDQTRDSPPTPANGQFSAEEHLAFSPNDIFDGENFVHVVSVTDQSEVGTVETVLSVRINTQGPSISSTSHPSQTFSANTNPFFAWSYPQGDDNVTAAYYLFDNFGDTVPTTADTPLPATQKQLLKSNTPPGIWVLHVVAADGQGRLTKAAGHYQVRIGNDPGTGSVQGSIVDANSNPIPGAVVEINRGLFTTTTSSNGSFTLPGVAAGTWELRAKFNALSATKTITVTPNQSTAGNLVLK